MWPGSLGYVVRSIREHEEKICRENSLRQVAGEEEPVEETTWRRDGVHQAPHYQHPLVTVSLAQRLFLKSQSIQRAVVLLSLKKNFPGDRVAQWLSVCLQLRV